MTTTTLALMPDFLDPVTLIGYFGTWALVGLLVVVFIESGVLFPVLPGDTIEYHMRSIGRRKAMWWFHGDAKVNGQVVAEADVGAMLTD
jgi:hypothetical protein